MTVHVGGTVIKTFIEAPGFFYGDDCFPLHRSFSMEFERTNPLACTVRRFDLVGREYMGIELIFGVTGGV